jgi:predicted phosphoribosyltransferase
LWDEKALKQIHVSEEWKKKRVEEKKMEVLKYRNELQFSSHFNHSNNFDHCLIVDDGAATGISMMAALSAAKTPLSGVAAMKIIAALPVASTEAAEVLKKNADEVVILHTDPYLEAVGVYYRQFEQVSWEKVKQLLESSYGTNKKIN